ncbi:hypothetical protein N7512_007619 [Penicillium capsulatum]|nr:hypothetical protein N7512_007619 [Penicillium capsulatum]
MSTGSSGQSLGPSSDAVFKRCTDGSDALFVDGWKGWPEKANQEDVLSWFADLGEKLATFSADHNRAMTHFRRPLAQPNKPVQGSTAERKLDIGFANDSNAGKDTRCQWSQILVPGELKSNPAADTASKAWLDLGRYAREVLAAQDTRRFVLGFTLCGSLMRIWAFDRLCDYITTASNYRPERSVPSTGTGATDASRKGRISGRSGTKRSSSQTGTSLPSSKRSCSASSIKASISPPPNRVHRRIILCDYGKPIYKASTRAALLAALEGCITGHQSLQRAGILHRDISINNLMINEDKENPSWPSFLIDLDLAIKEQRVGVSGANGKTGTRAFMAIGSLLGEKHSFMHDLESFFWVIF